MLQVEDHLSKYEAYSDEELYRVYMERDDYSEEANEALKIALDRRGGLGTMMSRLQEKEEKILEAEKIRLQTAKLFVPGKDASLLFNIISSDILTPDETHDIIERKYDELNAWHRDRAVNARTIYGSIAGSLLGSVIGGVLLGLQMIQLDKIFYLLIAGLFLLSYGLVRLFTRQSRANFVVYLSTILSVVAAVIIAHFIYENFK
jgi:hypothetical protein